MFCIPLTTQRYNIRRFISSDRDAFLAFMLDEDSTKYLAFEEDQKTIEGAVSLFDFVCNAYDSEDPIHSYAIAEIDSNKYVGSCGFSPYDNAIIECYYSINATERGKGIATEATIAMAIALSKNSEVRAYCHPENIAAHRVAEKSGFTRLGMRMHKNFGFEGLLFVYQRKD